MDYSELLWVMDWGGPDWTVHRSGASTRVVRERSVVDRYWIELWAGVDHERGRTIDQSGLMSIADCGVEQV